METLIIADRDVDHAQAAMLAIRNAGFDQPIFYVRSAAALLARLAKHAQSPESAPRPSAILIGLPLLRECGPELMRSLRELDTPVEVTAMLGGEKERFQLEQCGFRQIGYVVRPIKPVDVLRVFGIRSRSVTPPAGNPRLLWPALPGSTRRTAPQTIPH
ncbi:MAG TPA: hypothetical protein VFH71_02510 [Rhodanobacteraceae bacterium]|nr:hypothetical protein [Rhodanobacteraceae bacterium]